MDAEEDFADFVFGRWSRLVRAAVLLGCSGPEAEDLGPRATVTSATVIAALGTEGNSNTGHQCRSGRLLRLRLIGSFPGIGTGGFPGQAKDVRAVVVTADATSGLACLIGVTTAPVRPAPDSTPLLGFRVR